MELPRFAEQTARACFKGSKGHYNSSRRNIVRAQGQSTSGMNIEMYANEEVIEDAEPSAEDDELKAEEAEERKI